MTTSKDFLTVGVASESEGWGTRKLQRVWSICELGLKETTRSPIGAVEGAILQAL